MYHWGNMGIKKLKIYFTHSCKGSNGPFIISVPSPGSSSILEETVCKSCQVPLTITVSNTLNGGYVYVDDTLDKDVKVSFFKFDDEKEN